MPMDFFTKLGSKISDTTKDVTQKTKDVMEMSKLKGQISTEEKRIEETYTAIGKLFFEQNAGEVNEQYVEFFNAINDAKAKIAEYNTELCILKGTYNCPSCGAEVQVTAAFCAGCGTKLEPPVSKKEEAAEEVIVEDAEEVIVEDKNAESENN